MLALLAGLLLTGGCSTIQEYICKPSETSQGSSDAQKSPSDPVAQLEKARSMIMTGDDAPAKKLLNHLVTVKSPPGIAEEAMFHLGFLTFRGEAETSGYPQTRQLLDRLSLEYSDTVWGVEAEYLNNLITGRWLADVNLGKIRKQVKSLKDTNASLIRENKDLKLTIDKLKSLDLEMEHKSRR